MRLAPRGDDRPNPVPIEGEADMIEVRRLARSLADELGFGVVGVTRVVTAVSELARNVLTYAGEGEMAWRVLDEGGRRGLELQFRDRGPGIADVELALQAGYSTSKGLGLGLPGSARLLDELEIDSRPGEGTTITARKWGDRGARG